MTDYKFDSSHWLTFIKGHVVYNPAYNEILQTKKTFNKYKNMSLNSVNRLNFFTPQDLYTKA